MTSPTGRRRRRSRTVRRLTGGLALLLMLTALGFTYAAVTGAPSNTATAAAVDDGADRRGRADLRDVLHQLPRREPAGRRGSRAVAGRRRAGGRLLPGVHRAACRRPRRARRCRARSRSSPRIRSRPLAPSCRSTAAARSSRRAVCATTPRSRAAASSSGSTARRATTSPARAAPCPRASTRRTSTRRPTSRSGARCSPARRTCPSSATASSRRRRRPRSSSFIQNNKATIDPGGYAAGGFGPAPEGLIAFLVGMGAIVAAVLWMGSRT